MVEQARALFDEHERDRFTSKHRVPGIGLTPMFQILPAVFGDAE